MVIEVDSCLIELRVFGIWLYSSFLAPFFNFQLFFAKVFLKLLQKAEHLSMTEALRERPECGLLAARLLCLSFSSAVLFGVFSFLCFSSFMFLCNCGIQLKRTALRQITYDLNETNALRTFAVYDPQQLHFRDQAPADRLAGSPDLSCLASSSYGLWTSVSPQVIETQVYAHTCPGTAEEEAREQTAKDRDNDFVLSVLLECFPLCVV